MLAPDPKLVLWSGFLLVSAALVGVISPALSPIAVVGVAAFLAVVILDATLVVGRLDDIEIDSPVTTRMTRARRSEIALTLHQRSTRPRNVLVGLSLPECFRSEYEVLRAQLPEDAPTLSLLWPCEATTRGKYGASGVHLGLRSPLGFWSHYRTAPARFTIHVYPTIAHERKQVAALFLNRGLIGMHAQRQVGKGREYEKLREYVPGDSYEDIHWKATARRGHPVTKVFQIERTREVYVVVDSSRLSTRTVQTGTGRERMSQLERYLSTALILAHAAERQGDLFGVLAFDRNVKRFIRARSGRSHIGACREALHTLEANPVNPDFEEVFSFIRVRLRRRALLFFLTSLDDPVLAQEFSRSLRIIERQHLVLVGLLAPPDVRPVFTGPPPGTVDEIYGRLGGHLQWRMLRELISRLHHKNVTATILDHETMAAELVTQYVNIKRRQLL